MRYLLIAVWMLCCSVTSAVAQVSIGIGLPGISIGINLPVYPQLVRVPGYPVYYAPQLTSNFFFYDGLYWVYVGDDWYSSSWYNGPWGLVYPEFVPLFVLRIPVRYYRSPPPYFRDWRADAPPRWGEHWGRDWEQKHRGWDRWNHRVAPAPAPLPSYQRRYSGDRYPQQTEQQQALRNQHYRYQPRDPAVRQHDQRQLPPRAPAPDRRGPTGASPDRGGMPRQDAPRSGPPQRPDADYERPAPPQAAPRQRDPEGPDLRSRFPQGDHPREQRAPTSPQRDTARGQGGAQQEPNRGQGQGKKDRDRGDERGQ